MIWFAHDLSRVIEQILISLAVTLPHGAIEYANLNLRQWPGLSVERVLEEERILRNSGREC